MPTHSTPMFRQVVPLAALCLLSLLSAPTAEAAATQPVKSFTITNTTEYHPGWVTVDASPAFSDSVLANTFLQGQNASTFGIWSSTAIPASLRQGRAQCWGELVLG